MSRDHWSFSGDRMMFRTIPLGEIASWVDALRGKGRGRFDAAVRVVDRMPTAGAGTAGRLSKVRGSKVGLLLLRVTRAGDSPPHLRVCCIRRGDVIWLVHGFEQKARRLPESEIRRAERLAREFLDREDGAPPARGRAP
jgi:hypothetical protein